MTEKPSFFRRYGRAMLIAVTLVTAVAFIDPATAAKTALPIVAVVLLGRYVMQMPPLTDKRIVELNGLGCDYTTTFMNGAFGIDSRTRRIHFFHGQKRYSYPIGDVRDYELFWIDHHTYGSVATHTRSGWRVDFALRDAETPVFRLPVKGEHGANLVMEWMNQLREGVLPQREVPTYSEKGVRLDASPKAA